jgi:cis-3-alkyl-4-acyloxetan-2-one decarboxylase
MPMKRLAAPPMPTWLSNLVPFQRYRIKLGGYHFHVMEQGEGTPVFLLHGNPTWGFLYHKVAKYLENKPFRLIMPDLLGFGFSDKPRHAELHQFRNHSYWVAWLLEELGCKEMIFVGQDWGGSLGLHAMRHRPQQLSGLVLLNTVISEPRPGFRPTLFHRLSQTPLVSDVIFRGLNFPQSALWVAQGDRKSIRGSTARAYRYPFRHFRDRTAPLAMARMVPDSLDHPTIGPLIETREFVQQYRGPAEIVWGDHDPVLGTVRSWIEKLVPQAGVTRTQAGHFLQEEVPEQIAQAIERVQERRTLPVLDKLILQIATN